MSFSPRAASTFDNSMDLQFPSRAGRGFFYFVKRDGPRSGVESLREGIFGISHWDAEHEDPDVTRR
jgi:hypothetical protein